MNDLERRISNLPLEQRALLEQQLMKNEASAGVEKEITRREVNGPCPLSFSQQRLWFLNQMEPESPEYNIPKAIRLTGPLDVSALRQSIDAVLDRHEVLRTNYVSADGIPMQVVAEDLLHIPVRWPSAIGHVRECEEGPSSLIPTASWATVRVRLPPTPAIANLGRIALKLEL